MDDLGYTVERADNGGDLGRPWLAGRADGRINEVSLFASTPQPKRRQARDCDPVDRAEVRGDARRGPRNSGEHPRVNPGYVDTTRPDVGADTRWYDEPAAASALWRGDGERSHHDEFRVDDFRVDGSPVDALHGEGYVDHDFYDDATGDGVHGEHLYRDPRHDDDELVVDFWDDEPRRRWAFVPGRLSVRLALAGAAVLLVGAVVVAIDRDPGNDTATGIELPSDEREAIQPLTDSDVTIVADEATGDERALADQPTATTVPGLPMPTAEGDAADVDGAQSDEAGAGAGDGSTSEDAAESGTADGTSAGAVTAGATAGTGGDYGTNLALIRAQAVRNTNHDGSAYRDTPSAQLVPENHYGPRSEYLNNPGGNPEQAFPVDAGGQFRAGCEFSHFAYDDPLVYPGQPGAAHLHMFFGNTDVNAFTTYDTLINSGSSTCNGQELNRTGYWAPAMFDGDGNVRIPERVVVYYKGEGLARGKAEVFPEGAAMIADANLNAVDGAVGGAKGKFNFVCSDQYSGEASPLSNTMPSCDGNRFLNLYGVRDEPHVVLEMNVKFPQCWNGQDPANIDNFRHPANGSWYYSSCTGEFNRTLVNLEYFINYRVDIGENTSDWYLSSDVDPAVGVKSGPGGNSTHADWWGGWHKQTNQMFIDNCVNYAGAGRSGCGFGYLTDGGPNGNSPYDGPALKYRPQYTGPHKVPATQLFSELCPGQAVPGNPSGAAFCTAGRSNPGVG